MAIINNMLKMQLIKVIREKQRNPEQLADYILVVLHNGMKDIIKDVERGYTVAELEKKWTITKS